MIEEKVLVIGSGLAAYGTVLALLEDKNIKIDVIDIGLEEPYKNQPNQTILNSKDINGSFFPYGLNDKRWDIKIESKRLCSSHGFGGFSKVYSGSILQPQINDLKRWPSKSIPSEDDYYKIISSLKIKYKKDELENYFPLYPKNKTFNLTKKYILGNSRIAYEDNIQNETPFDVSNSFKKWSKEGLINYRNNCYVMKLEFIKNKIKVFVDLIGSKKIYTYNKVFVGAGCINTTSLIDRSLYKSGERNYNIKEAPILIQLCLKLDLRKIFIKNKSSYSSKYSLCNYFLEVKSREMNDLWSHTQIGSLNRIILEKAKVKLPSFIYYFISRLHNLFNFSQTFLHSDNAPVENKLISKITTKNKKNMQTIIINEKPYLINFKISNQIKIAIICKFKQLKLIPIPFSQLIGAFFRGNRLGGWHIGGTLPMKEKSNKLSNCKSTGELNGIRNVFVIDSSGFPSIPGSSVALLTMANSYRIAKNSLKN